MQFLITLLSLLTLFSSAFAAPPTSPSDLTKRSNGWVQFWAGAYYTGSKQYCETYDSGNWPGACQGMRFGLDNQVSSYKIYNSCCSMYVGGGCSGTARTHCSGKGQTYNMANLLSSGFNDAYTSFKCSSQY